MNGSSVSQRRFAGSERRSGSGVRWHPWAALLIVAAGAVAYANSLNGSFVLDDGRCIKDNPRIRHLWPLTDVLSHRRPVLDLSLAVNYAVGGLNVKGYHVVNIGIHVLAALTLYGIIRRTLMGERLGAPFRGSAVGPALTAALLWCVHPLQTQNVTYLIQRGESLMGLFYFLTLYAMIRGAVSRVRTWWYVTAVVCCALGMGSKAVMVTAPATVLLYDRTFLSSSFLDAVRRRWVLYLGLAATWIVLWVCGEAGGVLDPTHGVANVGFSYRDVTPAAYLMTQAGVLVKYLQLSLWPHPLCLDYDWPVARTFAAIAAPGVIIVVLLVGVVWAWFRRPWLGFVYAWFFLTLAPTSSFIPIRDALFEHRMYLPSAAVLTLLVIGGRRWLHELASRRRLSDGVRIAVTAILVASTVAVLSGATARRNRDYRTELGMWEDIVSKRPRNVRAQYNLGTRLLDADRLDEAVAAFREALQVNPRATPTHDNFATQTHYNLGKALSRRGEVAAAAAHYEEALRLDPTMAEAHSDLGNVLARAGRFEEAIDRYREAIRVNPNYVPTYFNLASVLMNLDRAGEAVDLLHRAVVISPETARLHFLLGNAYRQLGRPDAAIGAYDEALRLDPNDGRARSARDAVYAERGGMPSP